MRRRNAWLCCVVAAAWVVGTMGVAQGALFTLAPEVDTFVKKINATTSYGGANYLESYTEKSSYCSRTYLRFDLPAFMTDPDKVISASLELYCNKVHNGSATHGSAFDVNLYEAPGSWSGSTTWTTQPGLGSTVIAAEQLKADTSGSVVDGDWNTTSQAAQWDVTGLVQDWITAGANTSNNGVVLSVPDLTSKFVGAKYHSSEYTTDPSLRPRLVVQYPSALADVALLGGYTAQAGGSQGRGFGFGGPLQANKQQLNSATSNRDVALTAWGNFDGDQEPEAVFAHSTNMSIGYDGLIFVVKKDGSTVTEGTLTRARWNGTGHYQWNDMAIGDIDHDGYDEIVACYNKDNTGLVIFDNIDVDNPGAWTRTEILPRGTGKYVNRVAIGDIDGDGVLEVAIADNVQNGQIYALNGFENGFGSVTQTLVATGSTDRTWQDLATGDLDGNGLDEIIAPDNQSPTNATYNGAVKTWRWTGSSWAYILGCEPPSGWGVASQQSWTDVAVADIDGDGYDEIVAASNNDNNKPSFLTWFDDLELFTQSSVVRHDLSTLGPPPGDWASYQAITAADVDFDGCAEIFASHNNPTSGLPLLLGFDGLEANPTPSPYTIDTGASIYNTYVSLAARDMVPEPATLALLGLGALGLLRRRRR